MATYKKISKVLLAEWLCLIFKHIHIILLTGNKYSLSTFTVTLYEYLQVFSKLSLENKEYMENVKVTVKDIKAKVNVEECNPVLNSFKNLRDDLSHGAILDAQLLEIIELFNQSDLHSILSNIMPSEFMLEFYKLLDFLNGPEYESKRTLEAYRLRFNIYNESDWLTHYANLSKLANSTSDIDVARIVKNNFLY